MLSTVVSEHYAAAVMRLFKHPKVNCQIPKTGIDFSVTVLYSNNRPPPGQTKYDNDIFDPDGH